MVNFQRAIEWLKSGGKVRRPSWKKDSYWIFGIDEVITWNNKEEANVHLNQIEATDWEVYEEESNLGGKIFEVGQFPTLNMDVIQSKNVKECFKQIKEDIEDLDTGEHSEYGAGTTATIKSAIEIINKRAGEKLI